MTTALPSDDGIVRLADGYGLHVVTLGEGFPLVVLHGGPGVDHQGFRPWLDPLAGQVRLLYVDQRGQGRSERADPERLSIGVFADDVELLRDALGLERFAVLGHSFGAIVATRHAIEHGSAAGYVLSGGSDSSAGLARDVSAALADLGEAGEAIARAWSRVSATDTQDAFREVWRAQAPLHFAGPPPDDYGERMLFTPDVLRHFASPAGGTFDHRPFLSRIERPVLVVTGADDPIGSPRAARALHAGIAGSRLTLLAGAGHVAFVEAQAAYLEVVGEFLREVAVSRPAAREPAPDRSA